MIDLDDVLFQHEVVKGEILSTLPQVITDGLVEGTLLGDDTFVPTKYTAKLKAQERQVLDLQERGILDLTAFEECDVDDVGLFLDGKIEMGNEQEYTVLASCVVLTSFVDGKAKNIRERLAKERVIDLNEEGLFGVEEEHPDYEAIRKLCLAKVHELAAGLTTEEIYSKEKTRVPDYILTDSIKAELKNALEERLVVPAAKGAAGILFGANKDLEPFVENEAGLKVYVQERSEPLDPAKIQEFLATEFAQTAKPTKALPDAVMQHMGAVLEAGLVQLYEQVKVDELRGLYKRKKLDCAVSLLIDLRGTMDINKYEKKLAAKKFHDLLDFISKQSREVPSYLPPGIEKKLTISSMAEFLTAELEKEAAAASTVASNANASGTSVSTLLAQKQDELLQTLTQELEGKDDPPYVLFLALSIVHGKMSRYENQYGMINVTDKYAGKILKLLEKRVDVKELHRLKDAIKKGRVTPELINQVKDVALQWFH